MKDVPSPSWLAEMLNRLRAAWNAWCRFWFAPADPTTLGLVRIFAGLVTLYVYFAYTPDLQELFGAGAWIDLSAITDFRTEYPTLLPAKDFSEQEANLRGSEPAPGVDAAAKQFWQKWGVNPERVHALGYRAWSIWYHVTDPTAMAVIHALVLLAIFLFAIGFCTPVTSVLAWLGHISYVQRAPTSLFGMDTMMNLLLVYLMVGQSGAALSVDRLIARYRLVRRALAAGLPPPADLGPAPRVSANLGMRLIQVNLCIIYFTSGATKLMGNAWWMGNAVWGTLANPEFSPLYFGPFYDLLRSLGRNRALWEVFMTTSSAFTLATELSFAFLVWVPKMRWVMVTMCLMLHTGIAVFMGLTTFSLFMVAMLLSFVPPEVIRRLLGRAAGRPPRFRLAFDGRAPAVARVVSLVKAADVRDDVELVSIGRRHTAALASPRALELTGGGETLAGDAAIQRLYRTLWLLRPVGWLARLPGFRGLSHLDAPGRTVAVGAGADAEAPKARPEKVAR